MNGLLLYEVFTPETATGLFTFFVFRFFLTKAYPTHIIVTGYHCVLSP
jgi:hypothetical protein